jgi:hypothetical protein
VIDPGQKRVAFRRVSVASLGEEEVKIASGLRAGERVVALGAHLLGRDRRSGPAAK